MKQIHCIIYVWNTVDDEDIDVIQCYLDKDKADSECDRLNEERRKRTPNSYSGYYEVKGTNLIE